MSLGNPNKNRLDNFFEENDYIDIVVNGEGELTFEHILVESLKDEPNYKNVEGISTRDFITNDRQRIKDIDSMPSPYLDGLFNKIIDGSNSIAQNAYYHLAECYINLNSEIGDKYFQKISRQSNEKVFAELDWISKNKIRLVYNADSNFGLLPEHIDIAKHISNLKNKTGYPEMMNLDWAKSKADKVVELARILTKSKLLKGITIALQSTNPDVLKAVRRKNIDDGKLKEFIDLYRGENLRSYIELILGLPHETKETWLSGLCKLIESGQHNSIESWLTQMLENSQLNQEREEHGFDTVFLDNYYTSQEDFVEEKAEIVRGTKYMPFTDLVDAWMFSWLITNLHIYGWTQIYSIFLRKNKEVSYETFYAKLLDRVQQSDSIVGIEYRKTKERITHYLEGKETIDYSGHTLLWDSQQEFHKNRNNVLKFTEN